MVLLLTMSLLWGSRAGRRSMWRKWPVKTQVPRIGIVSKPLVEENYDIKTNLTQVIEAKYARYVEGGGALPIYINYKASKDELRLLFNSVNGLLLIGGSTNMTEVDPETNKTRLSAYSLQVKFLLDLAMEANDKGEYFPVWGTCQGYELLLLIMSENYDLLRSGCSCFGYNAVLEFTPLARSSKLLALYGTRQLYQLGVEPMTYNSHDLFVTVEDFYKSKRLRDEMLLLATSTSQNGSVRFVSVVEGARYPFYAVQYHPEKNGYDFNPFVPSNHSLPAIEAMQVIISFFANEARFSSHTFSSPAEEAKYSAYNTVLGLEPRIGPLYLYP
jgi:gamma-glutamyl hydrolase